MPAPAPTRRPAGPPMVGPGRMMAGGMPAEKLQDFKGSSKRLLGMLRPQRFLVGVVLLLGVASVTLSVIGPRLLGHATDVIFDGIVGRSLPAGVSKADLVERLRAQGETNRAGMLASMDVVPGQGVDFDRLGRIALWVLVIYVAAWIF